MSKYGKVDYSIKTITIRDGDKEYMISFRDSLLKGVRVCNLYGDFSEKTEVIDTHPALIGLMGNMIMFSAHKSKWLRNLGAAIAEKFKGRCIDDDYRLCTYPLKERT